MVNTVPSARASVIKRVVIAVVLTQSAALTAFVVTPELDGWFANLERPGFAPPNWLFAPVWTTLYILMGIAAGLVWARQGTAPVPKALTLYVAQLVLNALWSIVFFGMHAPTAALVVIVVLWVLITLTMRSFFPIRRISAWLLLPYLLWVSFATVLNAGYVVLN